MSDVEERIRRAMHSDCGHSSEQILAMPKEEIQTDVLLELLKRTDVDKDQHRRALYLLGRLGVRDAVDVIVELIGRLDTMGRISALDALGRIGGERAQQALMTQLSDPVPQVRQFAVLGIGRIGGESATVALRKASTDDPEPFVRSVAQRELDALSTR